MIQAECANVTGKVNGNVASAPCGDSDAHMTAGPGSLYAAEDADAAAPAPAGGDGGSDALGGGAIAAITILTIAAVAAVVAGPYFLSPSNSKAIWK